MPECREGTYAANGEKIVKLREDSRFKNRESFCDADPTISIPTLDRAESGGCLFKATLQKLATKLGLKSWRELLADPDSVPQSPTFSDPVARSIGIDRPFGTFDETVDGTDILAKIQLLIARKIPFIVLAFTPGSVNIITAFEREDAEELDSLYASGAMQPLGVVSFRPLPRYYTSPTGITIKSILFTSLDVSSPVLYTVDDDDEPPRASPT